MNATETKAATEARHHHRIGVACAIAAYGLWGVLPIYFKLVSAVDAIDIVAHRIFWSMLVLLILVTAIKGWPKVRAALGNRRRLGLLLLSAALIAGNWLLYVYAINSGHILAGSLGYYLNPLANILLGRFLLSERLSKLQWAAVAIAGLGVAVLAAGALDTLWISLTLCFSFATYGLIRKLVKVDSISGLTIETILLLPIALGWLTLGLASGREVAGPGGETIWLLMLSGVISTTPLLLFTEAARRLKYSTVGMLQFIAPTLQFLLAVWVYGEAFTTTHAVAFASIWSALALYMAGSYRASRSRALAEMA